MQLLVSIGILILSYIIGSIPFGYVFVWLGTRKDIRSVASGRTGGTNAFRAAGVWAGIGTAVMDALKSSLTVWIANAIAPGAVWLSIFAPTAAILGHNYSLFLAKRDEHGRLRLHGGAGGAPTVGGAIGFWFPSFLFVVPIGFLVWYFIGYASLTTMSIALIVTLIFAIRNALGIAPWQYILYGVIAEVLLLWALRPNIQRLIEGNERLVGWRANRRKKKQAEPEKAP